MQYNTIQYNAVQYNAIQYNTMPYDVMQCNAMQCNTIQYNIIQCMNNQLQIDEDAINKQWTRNKKRNETPIKQLLRCVALNMLIKMGFTIYSPMLEC